jgi:hypothetical protein
MAIPLGRSLPSASRDRPERRREGSPGISRCLPLLLGLAPGGVFPATAVAGGAVRSYRTVSPLPPARYSRRRRRCTFCGTFPGVAPAGCYPAPHLRGARTFLSPPVAESGHPAVWHQRIWVPPTALSNPSGSGRRRRRIRIVSSGWASIIPENQPKQPQKREGPPCR